MDSYLVGRPIADIDTPALIVDLDAMEHNIAAVSKEIASRGVAWRPHAKGHKCPAITHRQMAAGAIGVTCAKLGEAEVMAAAGVRDILVANQVVGPIKARRLAGLAAQADVIVAVDSAENVGELDAAAYALGTRPRVVIEVNTGMERAGTLPGEASVRLAEQVAKCKALRFTGVMGWEGHAMAVPDPAGRAAEIQKAVGLLTATADAVREVGIPVEIVSCGGSGTYLSSITVPGVTEVQAGGATFGDSTYRDLGVPVEAALSLFVTVTSRPAADRIIVDSGRKAVDPSNRLPHAVGLDGVVGMAFSAEHGTIRLSGPAEAPRVGDRLELQIGYHDQCVHLHERIFGLRDGVVETVLPVLG